MTEYTWETREIPILEAVASLEIRDEDPSFIDVVINVDADDLTRSEIRIGVQALLDAGYITGLIASTRDSFDVFGIRLQESGRRAIGQWPSPDHGYEQLLAMIDARLDATDDPDDRSKLDRLREGVVDAGRSVSVSLFTAWARQVLGM